MSVLAKHVLLLSLCALPFSQWLMAAEQSARPSLRQEDSATGLEVLGPLAPPAAGVTDLRFHEFFKLPVGPRGLDLSEKIRSLELHRVRLVGYMVRQEIPTSGVFILSPLPISLGDEDESLADDLPASVVFVHVEEQFSASRIPRMTGLISVTGVLSIGATEEQDGHVSSLRLTLDSSDAMALFKLNSNRSTPATN